MVRELRGGSRPGVGSEEQSSDCGSLEESQRPFLLGPAPPAPPCPSRTLPHRDKAGPGAGPGLRQRPACGNRLGVKLSARRSSDPYRGSAATAASPEQPQTYKERALKLLIYSETSPVGWGQAAPARRWWGWGLPSLLPPRGVWGGPGGPFKGQGWLCPAFWDGPSRGAWERCGASASVSPPVGINTCPSRPRNYRRVNHHTKNDSDMTFSGGRDPFLRAATPRGPFLQGGRVELCRVSPSPPKDRTAPVASPSPLSSGMGVSWVPGGRWLWGEPRGTQGCRTHGEGRALAAPLAPSPAPPPAGDDSPPVSF